MAVVDNCEQAVVEEENNAVCLGLVGSVCKDILENKRFDQPLESSKLFHTSAATILRSGNANEVQRFSGMLESHLSTSLGPKLKLSRIWSTFQTLTIGKQLNEIWKNFCVKVSIEVNPMFYQYVTEEVFKKMLLTKIDYTQATCNQTEDTSLFTDETHTVELTYEEKNALHYIGGYILRKLLSKVITKKTYIDALLLLQSDLPTGSDYAKWTECNDRGGLIHITEMFYHCLYAIERVTRFLLKTDCSQLSDIKQTVIDKAIDDVDVRFYWDLAVGMTPLAVSDELLYEIIDLYTTVRGHSFVKGFMEKYKQDNKKGTQKAKALRKKLF